MNIAYCWQIQARRLNDNKTYNPRGELIRCDQQAWYSKINEVDLVGKMKQVFVPDKMYE